MIAAEIATPAEIKKKLTLLVGNPARTATNLFNGWLFMYFRQFTSKKGNAMMAAANAQ
jgi:hypothetical protein